MVQVLAERMVDLESPALAELMAGRPIVVRGRGDADGQLVFLPHVASVAVMAFAVRHTSGFLCVGLPATRCDQLDLPPMWPMNVSAHAAAYTVTIDASSGITTGISAADRTHTARLLADERATPSDFNRPGHLVVAAAPGTGSFLDALLDLAVEAGGLPAVVFGAIVSPHDPVRMADCAEQKEFAAQHGLSVISLDGQGRRT
jgi:3,4-dihydroxy 2-butanone 4-phosphate synthase/GTP cyclohydrolase II